ncbi:MAG TPA: hypothetical protein PK313_10480, partial [Myxococcota bacterium]|nr:hypothetical protein [Myxococcota bacterium]
WALLLWPLGGDGAAGVMGRLRHSRRMIDDVAAIVAIGRALEGPDPDDVAATKRLLRRAQAPLAVAALGALRAARGLDAGPAGRAAGLLAGWTADDLHPARLVTGNDAMAAGVPRGPRVAAALRAVEDAQLRGNVGTREQALAMLRALR